MGVFAFTFSMFCMMRQQHQAEPSRGSMKSDNTHNDLGVREVRKGDLQLRLQHDISTDARVLNTQGLTVTADGLSPSLSAERTYWQAV